MEDLIVKTLGLFARIYFYGHLYLLWREWVYPTLKKYFSAAKSHFSERRRAIATEQSEFSNRKSLRNTLQRGFSVMQLFFSALQFLFSSMAKDFHTAIIESAFLHRNFPFLMRQLSTRKQQTTS